MDDEASCWGMVTDGSTASKSKMSVEAKKVRSSNSLAEAAGATGALRPAMNLDMLGVRRLGSMRPPRGSGRTVAVAGRGGARRGTPVQRGREGEGQSDGEEKEVVVWMDSCRKRRGERASCGACRFVINPRTSKGRAWGQVPGTSASRAESLRLANHVSGRGVVFGTRRCSLRSPRLEVQGTPAGRLQSQQTTLTWNLAAMAGEPPYGR
jgi:hypothetical protein